MKDNDKNLEGVLNSSRLQERRKTSAAEPSATMEVIPEVTEEAKKTAGRQTTEPRSII